MSPSSLANRLRPPLHKANLISRHEFEKIDCAKLQEMLASLLSHFQALIKVLLKIETRISTHWSVPAKVVRIAMKGIVQHLRANSEYLSKLLHLVARGARNILHFVGSCIKESHGLKDFNDCQDLKPLLSALSVLHSQFQEERTGIEAFGMTLSDATTVLEHAMDPDNYQPGSPPSRFILELSSTHSSLSSSLSSLSTFFKDLPISTWNPPLLSPEDVKSVAHSWRTLDDQSESTAQSVDEWSERLIDHSIKCKFFSRKEAGEMFGFDYEEEEHGMEVD
ncbi:hypothetical protein JCM5353_000595 [Sporobolomyces roseus]